MSHSSSEQIEQLVDALSGSVRRERQEAAHTLATITRQDSSAMAKHVDALVKALRVPEAQTRWEVLDALSILCAENPDKVASAFAGAEDSLFDEASSTVRLSAFRMLTRVGSTSNARSKKALALLDAAIQCFHGDAEYRDMLACLLEFAQGDIAADVRDALVQRVAFDAESAHGYIQSFSQNIIDATKQKAAKTGKTTKSKTQSAAKGSKRAKVASKKKAAELKLNEE
ncbi:hypothetical protein [Atopobium minutum]|uniref:hypothetical protein n=1 Tax=Atopobium minutum TaxID=1381 RepID=UPI00280AC36B|nr:hypothetical protein [Atopobium minutum]